MLVLNYYLYVLEFKVNLILISKLDNIKILAIFKNRYVLLPNNSNNKTIIISKK